MRVWHPVSDEQPAPEAGADAAAAANPPPPGTPSDADPQEQAPAAADAAAAPAAPGYAMRDLLASVVMAPPEALGRGDDQEQEMIPTGAEICSGGVGVSPQMDVERSAGGAPAVRVVTASGAGVGDSEAIMCARGRFPKFLSWLCDALISAAKERLPRPFGGARFSCGTCVAHPLSVVCLLSLSRPQRSRVWNTAEDVPQGSSRLLTDLTAPMRTHATLCGMQDPQGDLAFMAASWLPGGGGRIAVGCTGWKCLGDVAPVTVLDAAAGAVLWSTAPRRADAASVRGQRDDVSTIRSGFGGPAQDLLAVGYGDGTVALWDARCDTTGGKRVAQLAVGALLPGRTRRTALSEWKPEVTNVAFSHCGRFLAASGTHNHAPVWDVRMLASSEPSRELRAASALLHVLSHGPPAEVAEGVVGNQPGTASEGDQGINSLAFFHHEPMLVTAGSNGVGLWNLQLGVPEVMWRPHGQAASPHLRCVTTAAVHPTDRVFATAGDDTRVVLHKELGRGDCPLSMPNLYRTVAE